MKFIVAYLCCFALVVDGARTVCFEGALQEDIDFEKIAGVWNQVYFSTGTVYDDAVCIQSEIYNVSATSSTLEMTTNVVLSASQDQPTTQTMQSTASWADDVSKSANIKHHVTTDYDTYLIFYYCSLGRQFLDVRVRQSKQLHLRQIREIAEIADRLRSSFFDLEERAEPDCGSDFNQFA